MLSNYNTSNTLKDLQLCKVILKKNYPNFDKISLDKHKLDPFFSDNDKLIHLHDWYKSKNPNFLSMKDINPEMPEYECLVSGIVKDLYLLIENPIYYYRLKNYFESKSKKNRFIYILQIGKYNLQIRELLIKIENIIKNNYKYLDVIEIIWEYIKLFDTLVKKREANNYYKRYFYIDSPFIIYPSFHQLALYKVNLTYSSPFINFLLQNNNIHSHGINISPRSQIIHDIRIHYEFLIKGLEKIYQINNRSSNIFSFLNEIKKNNDLFIIFFNKMNDIILKLHDIIIYLKKNISFSNKNLFEFQNFMNSLLLFYLLHETDYFFEYIEVSSENNVSNKINKYFEDNFYKLCIINLFKNGKINFTKLNNLKNINTYVFNNLSNIFLNLNDELKELIENNLKIQITPDNIGIIIQLYKNAAIAIYTRLFSNK